MLSQFIIRCEIEHPGYCLSQHCPLEQLNYMCGGGNLTCIFAAMSSGSKRVPICMTSAISKVAFLERVDPVVDSSSIEVSA